MYRFGWVRGFRGKMLIRTKFPSEPERCMWHSRVWYFKVGDHRTCLLAFKQNFREHVYVTRLKIRGRPPDRWELLEVWYSVTSSHRSRQQLSGLTLEFHQSIRYSSIIFADTHLSSFPARNFVTWRPLIWRCSWFFWSFCTYRTLSGIAILLGITLLRVMKNSLIWF